MKSPTTSPTRRTSRSLSRPASLVAAALLTLEFNAHAQLVFSDNFDGGTIGAAPSQWTTTDLWRVRQHGVSKLVSGEDSTAGSGRKLSRTFPSAVTNSWTVDFDYAWSWGGHPTLLYGAYPQSVDVDMVDAGGNGYRLRMHQGNSGQSANDNKLTEIFRLAAGAATLMAQGTGYNEPGWRSRNLTNPDLNRVRFTWDQRTRELAAYRDLGAGLELCARVNNSAYASFTKVTLTTSGYANSEQPHFDNIVVNRPTRFQWGVAGHPTFPEYIDYGQTNQINLVKEAGCNYYRVDAWDEGRLDSLLPIADAQNINLVPILYKPIDIFDTAHSLTAVYQQCYNRGLSFAQKYHGRFTHIELDNELDIKCLAGNQSGASTSHYDDTLPLQKYSRCKQALKGLADGVRAGDATVKRLVGAAGWYHYGFIDRLVADGVPFEVLVWHWYSEMGSMSRVMHKLSVEKPQPDAT